MSNPLFSKGFYFFSGMYDDSLIGPFYQKISAETYDRAVQTQNNTIGRLRKTAEGRVHYQITFGDLKVDSNYNQIMGLPVGTLTAEIPDLLLPIWNQRKFWGTYGHSAIQIPVEDFMTRLDIFDKVPTIQLEGYRIMKARFVMDVGKTVRLALPTDPTARISYNAWGTDDLAKLQSLFGSKPNESIWIFFDEQSQMYHYHRDEINTAYEDDETRDFIVRFKTTDPILRNNVASRLNGSDANSWDFVAYSTTHGNLYLSCPCSFKGQDGDELQFLVPKAFFNYLKPNGAAVGVGGQYGYFIQRPNRRHMLQYNFSENHKAIFNLEYFDNPAGNTNIEIYEFDPTNYLKGRRLYSPALVQSYYPNIYDFQKLNENQANLLIEVNEYLPDMTNQRMRNSLQPLMDSLGDFYTNFVINGYDVHDGQGVSKIQRYAPSKFYSTTEDYLVSEYNGDIRAYMLDKLLRTFEKDPYLNLIYYDHMAKLDPIMCTSSGTPKDFGFNTNLAGEYSGDNPVVMSTREVIPTDENVMVFDEPHSYITFRSNEEEVAALLYLNGLYLRPTCQRFYRGVNYLFYPVEAIASVVSEMDEDDLVTLKPLVLDYFPHTHPSRALSVQEDRTILPENFKLFQHGEERWIRLRDIYVYNTRNKVFVDNWWNKFDVLYEVNEYEIQSTGARNTILLDQDADMNSVVPMLSGLYSNPAMKPLGKVQISLRETLSELTEQGVITGSDIFSLMNKSLNVKYLTFVPDESQYGLQLTFGLGNFKSEYRFTGDRLDIFTTSATGTLENAVVDPLRFGGQYNQYVLFRNGHLVKKMSLTTMDSKVVGKFIISITETGIQPTDEFVLIHLPVPLWYHEFELAEGLRYMQKGNVTGKNVETIWPDDYLPYTDGLLLQEAEIDGSTIPLESSNAIKFSDNGYRLPGRSKSTYTEGALYYSPEVSQLLPDKHLDAPVVYRYPIDLPFTHPTNIPKMSILASILGGNEPVIDWFDLNFANAEDQIRSIYYGKNMMSVTGNFSSGTFSGDGEFWEKINFPDAVASWRTILYQNKTFIALGTNSNIAAHSTNGTLWDAVQLPRTANWYAAAYGQSKFVALAMDSAHGAYSFDGLEWSEMTLPANRRWISVAYGKGLFVAVASTSKYGAYSKDGITWEEIELPHGDWCSVAFISTGFLAIDPSFNLGAYSTDGVNWNLVNLPENIDWIDVNNGYYHFSIVAHNTTSSTNSRFGGFTTDGVNWEVSPNGSVYWDPIASGDNTHIKFGFIDGDSSTVIEIASYFNLYTYEGAEKIREIYYAQDQAMILGDFSGGAFSDTGAIWADMNLPEDQNAWRAFMYADGKFVAIPKNSKIAAYSTNGSTWNASELPDELNWYALSYGYNRFITLALDSKYGAYSSTGETWTRFTLPSVQRWNSVAYGNGRFVAIAQYSYVGAHSIDGEIWTSLDLPNTKPWGSVVFCNGNFMLISEDLQTGAVSVDGIEWTIVDLPENIDWITVKGEDSRFMIVANNEAAGESIFGGYSDDGLNWEVTTNLSDHWNPIASGTSNSIMVGFSRYTEDD